MIEEPLSGNGGHCRAQVLIHCETVRQNAVVTYKKSDGHDVERYVLLLVCKLLPSVISGSCSSKIFCMMSSPSKLFFDSPVAKIMEGNAEYPVVERASALN